jgi:hypothetical protein
MGIILASPDLLALPRLQLLPPFVHDLEVSRAPHLAEGYEWVIRSEASQELANPTQSAGRSILFGATASSAARGQPHNGPI